MTVTENRTSFALDHRSPRPIRRTGLRWMLALLVLLIPLTAISHVAATAAMDNDGPSRQATPSGSEPAATPAATPDLPEETACSVVLGIGEETDACLAFVNAIPGSDPVDFTSTAAEDLRVEALGSGEFADFIAVPGETDLDLAVNAADVLVAEGTLRLPAAIASVLVLGQQYDQVGSTLAVAPLDLSPLAPGQARVAFHHSVTDAADLAVLGLGAPSEAGILPGETTEPVTIDAGQVTITVVPANAQEVALATLDLLLEPDLSYLVVIGGTTGDQTVEAIYAAAPVAST